MGGEQAFQMGDVRWGPTLVLNFERLVAASLVWCGIALAMAAGGAAPAGQALVFLLAPLTFPVFAPFAAAMQWLARKGVPFVGWLAFFSMLFLMLGDPLLWLLHRVAPGLVPVERYRFFDRHLLLFVIDQDGESRPRLPRQRGSEPGSHDPRPAPAVHEPRGYDPGAARVDASPVRRLRGR